MSYESTSIARIITKLNIEYFLPAIQRPFVWKSEQLVRLFDSIMKGYPISSFLFWDLEDERKRDWDIYKFIENFSHGDTHNEIASTDGLNVNLVLDGQQRLTSLFIGLKGTYKTKKKFKRHAKADAWLTKRLYIDLLKDPKIDDEEASTEVSYGFEMFEFEPKNVESKYWFRVGKILDFNDLEEFDDYKEELREQLPDTITKGELKLFERNLNRLRKVVWEDDVIAYYTESSQNYDRVLDIFIRANDGGTKLSKSDLLLSMMTSKWGERNAREEIYNFVDVLNKNLPQKNNIDKEVVMKACLLLTDLPHTYKVSNFTKENLEKIQHNWPIIQGGLKSALSLVNKFGIDSKTLLSANALLPIAYYLSKTDCFTFESNESQAQKNRLRIQRWIVIALLNNTFGSTTDRVIGQARDVIKESLIKSDDFPLNELIVGLRRHGTFPKLDKDFIEDILETTYRNKTCFLVLSLMHEGRNFGDNDYHIDHLFPKSSFTTSSLLNSGITEANIPAYKEYANRLGNLQILSWTDNTKKTKKEFSQWVTRCDDQYMDEHCIPRNEDLFELDKFIDFVTKREQLIKERFIENLSFDSL